MLKQEKLDNILETVNTKGTITVKEIMTRLDVSDMTARRYLQELADKDLLVRVHGGAEKIRTGSILNNERSNIEKQSLQIAEKQLEKAKPEKDLLVDRYWAQIVASVGQE